jgi:hypothetical protein
MSWLAVVHFVAGLVVLAEALNKLERTHLFVRGRPGRQTATAWLKALAWSLLAVGGAGALATPFLADRFEQPTLQDVCVILGFAVLIVRTRVKEG